MYILLVNDGNENKMYGPGTVEELKAFAQKLVGTATLTPLAHDWCQNAVEGWFIDGRDSLYSIHELRPLN